MRHIYVLIFAFVASTALLAQCPEPVWADEFDGSALNPDNWTYEIGDGCDLGVNLCGWGNNELQSYQQDNAVVADGMLTITARREQVGNSNYTSARIVTKDKQDFTYGRMEARIKVAGGRGTWPAFWMLSTDEVYGGWPRSGEIDIMEFVGREPNEVIGTIHYGQPFPNNQFNTNAIEFAEPVADDFHEFAVEWKPNEIRWFVDGILYATERPADLNGQRWPFDQDFHFLLNLAVGGNLAGPVDPSAFPARMIVDYVRVFDGDRPYITGDRLVASDASGVRYRIGSVPAETAVQWTVPEGATIVSGQGTPTLTVDWAGEGGAVIGVASLSCGEQTLATRVEVEPAFTRNRSLENFDDAADLTFESSTGTLTEVANPEPSAITPASRVGKYVRDAGSQYDVIVYGVSAITDASDFVEGEQRFFVDLYTTAPVGTDVLLQLETPSAAGSDYPVGRHSRYRARTTVTGKWERLYLPFLDRPDASAPDRAVKKAVVLFAPNGNTGDTFYFDNFDVYSADPTGLLQTVRPDFPLTASPNPVGDLLTLQFAADRSGSASVEIFSVTGQLLLRKDYGRSDAATGQLRISVAGLAAGTYLARLRLGDGEAAVRFVR